MPLYFASEKSQVFAAGHNRGFEMSHASRTHSLDGFSYTRKNSFMKRLSPPVCPRCNTNEDVKKIAYGCLPCETPEEADSEGYVLGGCCIRPDSPEWYCGACEESFGTERDSWGELLTQTIQ